MSAFTVLISPQFERLVRSFRKHNPDFEDAFASAIEILASNPYGKSEPHHIRKLKGVPPGEGQFRLRIGRWRFRYDIYGADVLLVYCGIRREITYK